MKEYFQSYHGYFWQWEDEGHVAAIPHSATISYTRYLGALIEKLAPQGLPPFGSLLLANIAMNPEGAASLDVVYKIMCTRLNTTDEIDLTRAISFLKLLAALPQPYKDGHKRILVVQTIFERSQNKLSIKNSESIVDLYKKGLVPEPKTEFHKGTFLEDFRPLSLLESRFPDTQSIINRIASLPDPKQIEIEFEERAGTDKPSKGDLIDELINNSKTQPVGSLIRWLWGGLNIPVHSSLPSQQPLGGISDLTNKGDFDKLLISEFANDDLFFLSRLANNEALYIHREIPPAHNNLQRLVLIDVTLKNWGTPRLVAFGAMMAIARHPKTDIPCSAFVLGHEKYYAIATESVDQIIDALTILDGGLHPGKSLTAFLKDAGSTHNKEIFLITEKSTLRQPGLLRVINEHPGKIHYMLLTDASGTIDLYKRERSIRHVQHIRVPVENLWATNKQKMQGKAEVPVSTKFNVDYPILLRGERHVKSVLTAPDGEIFQITLERSVLRHFQPSNHTKRGWDLVCRDLPYRTEICEIGINSAGEYILLLFNTLDREISLINLQQGEKHSFVFSHWKKTSDTVPSFIFESGNFYHCNHRGCWSISTTGEIEDVDIFDRNKFTERHKILSAAAQKYPSNYGVFKNVNKVYINPSGQLVFNVHALVLTSDGQHLKLTPTRDQEARLLATNSSNHVFTFEDGSTIEVNRTGMIILRSSDRMIPAIYLPTTLDSSLGISTTEEFAGNEYYFKEQTCQVILNSWGNNPTAIVEALYKRRSNHWPDGRDFVPVEDGPTTIIPYCPPQEAMEFQQWASHTGATIEVIQPEGQTGQEIKKIPVSKFFNKHVGRFINTIVNHGAKNTGRR